MADSKVDTVHGSEEMVLDSDRTNKGVEAGAEVTEPEDVKLEEVKTDEVSTAVKTREADANGDSKSDPKHDSKNGSRNSRGRGNHNNHRENGTKFDPSVMPITDDAGRIRAQVEFYFSDSNLPTDKFLWELTDGTSNKPVDLKTIHKFKRMQRFQPYSAVVAALQTSESLELSGEEGSETVKRKIAYDPQADKRQEILSRSIYVKGFGEEQPSTQFDIEAFFSPYGPTNAVRLRRSEDKVFKGSVFVEFADEETAKKFLDLDPKPLWQGKHELQIMPKKEYTDGKLQDIKDGKLEPSETRKYHGGKGRGRDRGRGGRGGGRFNDRGDRDPNDWKKRREEDQRSGFRENRRGRGKDRNRDEPSKKRAREGDEAEEEAPAKKVDTKEEAPVETS